MLTGIILEVVRPGNWYYLSAMLDCCIISVCTVLTGVCWNAPLISPSLFGLFSLSPFFSYCCWLHAIPNLRQACRSALLRHRPLPLCLTDLAPAPSQSGSRAL